ncbi:MAG: hypothetical protein H3C62_14245 [Gemmatimonadaceae bacterium]|nr:hypothetical protein [Gemmatimonadaceae bacterium]
MSKQFFAKNWPQQELDGLASLEAGGPDRILPIWLEVDRVAVANYSPMLAHRLAFDSARGIPDAMSEILRAVERAPREASPSEPIHRAARRTAADARLRSRNLVGDEDSQFGLSEERLLARGLDPADYTEGALARWSADGAYLLVQWPSGGIGWSEG